MTRANSAKASLAAPLRAIDTLDVDERRAAATKRIVADDPYLAGHYPGFPIFPGVFVVEAISQAVAGWVASHEPGRHTRLAAVESVRFLAPLRPGDTLRVTLDVEIVEDVVRAVARCLDQSGRRVAAATVRATVSGAADA